MILPFSVVIKGRAFRATDDGTIEQLTWGKWHRFTKKPTHQVARDALCQAAELLNIDAVGV